MAPRPNRSSLSGYEPDLKPIADFDFGRSELLETGSFSDFTIMSRGVELKVHRACLAGASPYFDGVIDSGFAESINKCLEMNNESPEAIFIIIWYIYTKTYPAMKHSDLEWSDELEGTFLNAAPAAMSQFKQHLFIPHMEVLKLADMVMLPRLREIAFEELRTQLLRFPPECDKLTKYENTDYTSWASVPDFQKAVSMVYADDETCLDTLRLFFAWICIYNAWKWQSGSQDFEELVIQNPAFGWALYTERDRWGPQNPPACRNCAKVDTSYPNTLVYEPDDTFSVLTCNCRFRGFCMKGCNVKDENLMELVPTYCAKCSTGNRKPFTIEYVKRGDNGLELITDGSCCKLIAKGSYHKVDAATSF